MVGSVEHTKAKRHTVLRYYKFYRVRVNSFLWNKDHCGRIRLLYDTFSPLSPRFATIRFSLLRCLRVFTAGAVHAFMRLRSLQASRLKGLQFQVSGVTNLTKIHSQHFTTRPVKESIEGAERQAPDKFQPDEKMMAVDCISTLNGEHRRFRQGRRIPTIKDNT